MGWAPGLWTLRLLQALSGTLPRQEDIGSTVPAWLRVPGARRLLPRAGWGQAAGDSAWPGEARPAGRGWGPLPAARAPAHCHSAVAGLPPTLRNVLGPRAGPKTAALLAFCRRSEFSGSGTLACPVLSGIDREPRGQASRSRLLRGGALGGRRQGSPRRRADDGARGCTFSGPRSSHAS